MLLEIVKENKGLQQKMSQMKALEAALVNLQKKHDEVKRYEAVLE